MDRLMFCDRWALNSALRTVLALAVILPGVPPAAAQDDLIGSWQLNGIVRAQVRAGHRVGHGRERFAAVITFNEDGTYSQPGSVFCGDQGTADLMEVGRWVALGHNRFTLEPANTNELVEEVDDCLLDNNPYLTGRVGVEATEYRHRVKLIRGGSGLVIRTKFRGIFRVSDRRLPVRASGRARGTPLANAADAGYEQRAAPSRGSIPEALAVQSAVRSAFRTHARTSETSEASE